MASRSSGMLDKASEKMIDPGRWGSAGFKGVWGLRVCGV